jgi:hypothetical protein
LRCRREIELARRDLRRVVGSPLFSSGSWRRLYGYGSRWGQFNLTLELVLLFDLDEEYLGYLLAGAWARIGDDDITC